jgi:hypothetical protein
MNGINLMRPFSSERTVGLEVVQVDGKSALLRLDVRAFPVTLTAMPNLRAASDSVKITPVFGGARSPSRNRAHRPVYCSCKVARTSELDIRNLSFKLREQIKHKKFSTKRLERNI